MVAVTRATLARQLKSSEIKTSTSRSIRKKVIKKKKRTIKQCTVLSSSTTKTSTTTTTTSVPIQAYNEVVGKSDINDALAYDRYYNPIGREYDLGRDGAFMGFNILIAQFYTDFQFNDAAMQIPIDELKIKGFQVKLVKTEDECMKELSSNHYQVAWIISSNSNPNLEFTSSLINFHSNGGAIFLFADNTPLCMSCK
ncbi:hypothetical protein I4U23_014570 [Adineta vaga]|nr:hypothetical protein I4U23_014570 [Adineta vaga]